MQQGVSNLGEDGLLNLSRGIEARLDVARLLASRIDDPPVPNVSWIKAWMRYPAFDRVIPMGELLAQDGDFECHALLLAHELTHVMSLRGPIGFAMTAFRIALLKAETTLWRKHHPAADDAFHAAFLDHGGIAPVLPGAIGQLPMAEVACAAVLKLKMLQQVWLPLLEGLAVFGESCADPADDRCVINDVAMCIRNLFDFQAPPGGPDQLREAYMAFVQDFEAALSQAVRRSGPRRLEQYLLASGKTYFCGYLAIRAVVSRMRITAGRPIKGEQAFRLLLHAFKFGTFEVVPEMDLAPDEFFDAAADRMRGFVEMLARLPASDILTFLDHDDPKSSPGPYVWERGIPVPIAQDAAAEEKYRTEFRSWMHWHTMRALMPSLVGVREAPEGLDVSRNGQYLRLVLTSAHRASAKGILDNAPAVDLDGIFRLFERDNALLPIGIAQARFWLDVADDESGLLSLLIPTREPDPETHAMSFESRSIVVGRGDVEALRSHYAASGATHMRVARVALCDDRYFGLHRSFYIHVLFLWYGRFSYLAECGDISAEILDNAEEAGTNELLDALERRFRPDARVAIERDVIAAGERRAAAVLEWIDGCATWSHAGLSPDVSEWRADIRSHACRVLDAAEWDEDAGFAAYARGMTLVGVFGDCEGLAALVEGGFRAAAKERRNEVIAALFSSGLAPEACACISERPDLFSMGGEPLFHEGPFGWDVRPAVVREAANQDGDHSDR